MEPRRSVVFCALCIVSTGGKMSGSYNGGRCIQAIENGRCSARPYALEPLSVSAPVKEHLPGTR
jgi:hypothetical protein